MKIIISPAKKMNVDEDSLIARSIPVFENKAIQLIDYIKNLSYEELKKLWNCNDKIAALNYNRYKEMNLLQSHTPAIISYEGIQYQYMAPKVFTDEEWRYVNNNLRILSGLYGILKPLDKITPYRLEMQTKLKTNFCNNLYDFWNGSIYSQLADNTDTIINLASKEYSRVVEDYLQSDIRYVTCIFGSLQDGKIKMTGTKVKMARGSMVRFMAANHIKDVEQLKQFKELNYKFNKRLSTRNKLVFIENMTAEENHRS